MINDILAKLNRIKNANLANKGWLEDTRADLMGHMKASPIGGKPSAPDMSLPWLAKTVNFLSPLTRSVPAFSAIVLIALVITSSAAGSANPGDGLYFWKLNVNEGIRSVLSVGPASKANYNLELVQKRLDEVTVLSLRGKSTPELQDKIQHELESQVNKTQNIISDLSSDEALETTTRLHSILNANKTVLTQLELKSGGESKKQISSAVNVVSKSQAQVEQKTSTLTSEKTVEATEENMPALTVNKIKVAQNIINDVSRLIVENHLKGSLIEQAKLDLEVAKNSIAKAVVLADSGQFSDAYFRAQSAFQSAVDAKALVEVTNSINPEVRQKLIDENNLAPRIDSITPNQAKINSLITIKGSGFLANNNSVKIGSGYLVGVKSIDTKTINIAVPASLRTCPSDITVCQIHQSYKPGSYEVMVVTEVGESNTMTLTIVSNETKVPTISGLNLETASVGSTIIISGTNFSNRNEILLGDINLGLIDAFDNNTIEIVLPESGLDVDGKERPLVSGSYNIVVKSENGTSSGFEIRITPIRLTPEPTASPSTNPSPTPTPEVQASPPNITAITPTKFGVSANVTISGTGFTDSNTIYFNGTSKLSDVKSENGKILSFKMPLIDNLGNPVIKVLVTVENINGASSPFEVEVISDF